MKPIRIFIFILFFVLTNNLIAKEESSKLVMPSRADSHAPISIMGDHIHKAKEVMISYRYMTMKMDDYQSGSSSSNYTAARKKPLGGFYMSVPEEMTKNMHMIGAMYAPSDDLTLMIMSSYIDSEMKIKKHMNGAKKTLESSGFGDTKITALKSIDHVNDLKIHAALGLSLPTGSISKKDIMFGKNEETLGYGMQLGSGTFDVLSGVTFANLQKKYSYGLQLSSVLRIGKNNKEYSLGDIYQSNVWFAVPFNDSQTSVSIGARYKFQTKIEGSHKDIPNIMSFAQDPDSSGSKRVDLSVGINHIFPNKIRIALEYIMPTYNDVNSVQLDSENGMVFGLQYAY